MIEESEPAPKDILLRWNAQTGFWAWEGSTGDKGLPEGEYLIYRRAGTLRVVIKQEIEELP